MIGVSQLSNLYQRLRVIRRYNTTPCVLFENVSSHMYLVALLSMILAQNKGMNMERVLGMALSHDMEEAFQGDMVASAKRFCPEVREVLDKAADEFLDIVLEGIPLRAMLHSFWKEFKDQETEEAKLVKIADVISQLFPMVTEAYMGNSFAAEIISNSYISLSEKCNDSELMQEIEGLIKKMGIDPIMSKGKW